MEVLRGQEFLSGFSAPWGRFCSFVEPSYLTGGPRGVRKGALGQNLSENRHGVPTIPGAVGPCGVPKSWG